MSLSSIFSRQIRSVTYSNKNDPKNKIVQRIDGQFKIADIASEKNESFKGMV